MGAECLSEAVAERSDLVPILRGETTNQLHCRKHWADFMYVVSRLTLVRCCVRCSQRVDFADVSVSASALLDRYFTRTETWRCGIGTACGRPSAALGCDPTCG